MGPITFDERTDNLGALNLHFHGRRTSQDGFSEGTRRTRTGISARRSNLQGVISLDNVRNTERRQISELSLGYRAWFITTGNEGCGLRVPISWRVKAHHTEALTWDRHPCRALLGSSRRSNKMEVADDAGEWRSIVRLDSESGCQRRLQAASEGDEAQGSPLW